MKARVLSGLDSIDTVRSLLSSGRVGLMTNHTGVDRRLRAGIDILHARCRLTALFACEHGVRGNLQAGAPVKTHVDPDTGVTVHSCYGGAERLTDEMLDAFDVFVFDMQDVGARYYTYLYSLSYAMEACAAAGKPVVVLDRINPVGGDVVQGTLLDERFASFVGAWAMPTRYGMTIGEYARWVRACLRLDLDLTVVPLRGWKRRMLLEDTDVPWVAPSPNLPTGRSALVYTGTCVFEATNVSEGRGTTQPFELIGAPWVDAARWEGTLNALGLPGIRFRRACFTPSFGKHCGAACHGVQMHVLDPAVANPFAAGLFMLETLKAQHPDSFSYLPGGDMAQMRLDLLLGTDAFGSGVLDARGLVARHAPLVEDFRQRSRAFWLYD